MAVSAMKRSSMVSPDTAVDGGGYGGERRRAAFEWWKTVFVLVKGVFEQKKPDSDSEGTRSDEPLQASFPRETETGDPNDESTKLIQAVAEAEGTSTSTAAAATGGEEEQHSAAATEELEKASKFAYFATPLVVSLFVFHQLSSGKSPTLLSDLINLFLLAAFASGLSIIITIWAPSFSCQVPIIRGLTYVTIGLIALSLVSFSIPLMKAMSVLVFVPTIAVVLVACILVYWNKTKRSAGQHMRRPAV